MSVASAADIFRAAADVQSLFPRGFNVMAECLRHGVRSVGLKVRFLRPSPARCDVEDGEISFDPTYFTPDARALIARGIWLRTGVQVEPGEVAVWAYYHEVSHMKRGPDRLVERPLFGRPSLVDSIFHDEEEMACEGFAEREFKKWKRGLKP